MSQYVRHDLVVNPKRGEALPANATKGFLWLPNSAGDPGTPSAPEANVTPVIYDSTAKVLKFWDGTAWKSTEGEAGTGGASLWGNVGDNGMGGYELIPRVAGADDETNSVTIGANDIGMDEAIMLNVGHAVGFDENGVQKGRIYAHEIRSRDCFAVGASGYKSSGVTGSHTVVEGLYFSGGKLYAYYRTVEVKGGIITSWPTGSVSATLVPGQ
jgi:hypothetical protein